MIKLCREINKRQKKLAKVIGKVKKKKEEWTRSRKPKI